MRNLLVLLSLVLLVLAAGPVRGSQDPEEPLADTTVGIQVALAFEHPRADLELSPPEDRASVLARIAGREQLPGGTTRYRLLVMAVRPGIHDLAELVVTPDGERPAELGPLPVRVRSLLPPDHGGDLEELAREAPRIAGRFRLITGVLVVLWTLPLVALLVGRLRRRAPPPPPPAPPPTLADQLRPLVEAALAGRATRAERARLERLLLTHWSDRLGLAALSPARALAELRRHDEAGALLRTLEGWLHAREAAAAGPEEVARALAPYRDARPIEAPASATPEAVP